MNATRTRKTTTTRKAPAVAKRAKPAKRAKTVPVAPAAPRPLTDAQVTEVLRLIKGAGSVEIKLSVPSTGHRAMIKGIGFDPVEAQPRQAYFFDTPDLALNKAGVVVRARRIQGGKADTVIKRRPADPATIDAELRRSPAFKIEVDVMPGGFVCSASCKGVCTGQEVLEVIAGKKPLRSLFSKEQRAFYNAHAPKDVTMDKLATLGPTFLLKARHQPKDFDGRITVEMWLYPDGSRIREISTKCQPEEAFQALAEFRAYLTRCGIAIGSAQETKTKTALEFFSARLKEELAAG